MIGVSDRSQNSRNKQYKLSFSLQYWEIFVPSVVNLFNFIY